MRKVLWIVAAIFALILCITYAVKIYLGLQVSAFAALVPWILVLANNLEKLESSK